MANTKIPVELSSTPSIVDNGDATAITIDSSERIGLNGLTPSNYWTSADDLVLGGTSSSTNTGMSIVSATDSSGSVYFADGTSGADRYRGIISYNHSSDSFDFHTNAAYALSIDTNGRLGIGTTAPNRNIHINGTGDVALGITNANTGTSASDGFSITVESPTPDVVIRQREANNMRFLTNNTERLRIDSAGRMFLGGTQGFGSGFFEVNASPTSYNHIVTRPTVNTTYNALRMINNSNTVIGTVSVGTSVNTVTYGGTSDYRLKENIQPMEQGLERVKKLKPVQFDWKETGESSEGFIAHEIQDAGWNLGVVGEKDGKEMQEVEYGKLTPLLVKAIQEQQDIIDDLKSRIETLEK